MRQSTPSKPLGTNMQEPPSTQRRSQIFEDPFEQVHINIITISTPYNDNDNDNEEPDGYQLA